MKYFRARPKLIGGGMIVDELPHRLVTSDVNIINKLAPDWIVGDVFNWCNDNYGEMLYGWAFGLRGGILTFYFVSKEDAMAFKLRWL